MYRGERLNGYTHLAGSVLAVAGVATLVNAAAHRSDSLRLLSFSVYGASLLAVYLASTFYHSTRGRLKDFFRKLDHSAIYLLIAGTYTPFALVALRGTPGWTLFLVAWCLAVVGIAQEVWLAKRARLLSLAIYLVMGWMGLTFVMPLIQALTWHGFAWLLGGGVVYTVGVFFYLFDERFAHWHGIWHLFVMAGSAVHYLAILKFIA